jgi:hypothetical protein
MYPLPQKHHSERTDSDLATDFKRALIETSVLSALAVTAPGAAEKSVAFSGRSHFYS